MPLRSRSRLAPALRSAVAVGVLVLVPGACAVLAQRVLLFPSLGPSVLMQVHTPDERSARVYNVVASHLVALAAGFVAVLLFGLAEGPSVFDVRAVSPARVGAAAVACALSTVVTLLMRAEHPPAASTTLLVALGSFKPTMRDTVAVVAGVMIVGAAGEAARRIRSREADHPAGGAG